jgi:soluble lytic murein transglycosylase-like protein
MSLDAIASGLAATGVAYAPEIAGAARRHGVDPDLLAAVAAQETGGPDTNAGHNIVGDSGHGHGLFQIDDRSHPFASTAAAMDPGQNSDYAAGMIADLLKQYGGNVRAALSAYNTGSPTATGTKTRWSDGSNLSYADSVLRHYQRLTNGSAPETSHLRAESDATIASVGALRSRAQHFPMSMPAPASSHRAHSYQRQATNYLQLLTDDPNETAS